MVTKIQNKIKIWAGVLFAQFILFYFFSKSQFICDFFIQWFYLKQNVHISFFKWIPFSIGDVFYIFLLFFFVVALIQILRKTNRKKRILQTLIVINILYFLYQINWGMLYFSKPILEEHKTQKISTQELINLTEDFIEITNFLRTQVKENNNGIFSIEDWKTLEKSIKEGEKNLPREYYNQQLKATNSKYSAFGSFMNYTGVLGYYNPFTAEAHINKNLPNTVLPFTEAHERAHQLGFAREQEANFIGFLICENSKNHALRYSAYFYTTRYLLLMINNIDKNKGENLKRKLNKDVKKDILFENEFWIKYEGPTKAFFHVTNDLFLKSNQQDGAITYSYFINLLIRHKKESHLAM